MKSDYLYARIIDAKFVSEFQSFILVIEDVESRKTMDRPLQISKANMLGSIGISPDHPEITDELMHYFAKMLKERDRDKPIRIEWGDVDELSPLIEKELDKINKADENRAGQTIDEFSKKLNHGLFLEE